MRLKARAVNRALTKEAQERIDAVPRDHPDATLKILKIKIADLWKPRMEADRRSGKYSERDIKDRHFDRVRSYVQVQQKFRGLRKEEAKGPTYEPPLRTEAEKKKAKTDKRETNQMTKLRRLETLANLCYWFVSLARHHPVVAASAYEWMQREEEGELEGAALLEAQSCLKELMLQLSSPARRANTDCGKITDIAGDGPCAIHNSRKHDYCIDERDLADDEQRAIETFTVEECIEEAVTNFSDARARQVHQRFDLTYRRAWVFGVPEPLGNSKPDNLKWMIGYDLAKLFLSILLVLPHKKEALHEVREEKKRKEPESTDEEDEEKERKGPDEKRLTRRTQGAASSSKAMQGSDTQRKRGSADEPADERSGKRRACFVSAAPLRCSLSSLPVLMPMMACLPGVVNAMEVVHAYPVVTSPWALMSVLGSLAWYMTGTSVMVAIPVAVERLEKEVEGIMSEVAENSKTMVRCVSQGLLFLMMVPFVWASIG